MHTSAPLPSDAIVETGTPARLDRLPWGRFHTLVVIALGVTWILDGLEVTLAGAVSGALKESPRLHFSNADVGLASSAYLFGAVAGALLFGWLTDRLGRKRLDWAARSRTAGAGPRLAPRLLHRRRAWRRDLHHALVDSGIAALADDAWPCHRG